MRILIIGASQGTGAEAVRAALARGHEVTALARTPSKLELEHPKLTKLAGDFHRRASIDAAVVGHDAVIVTASASSLGTWKSMPDYFTRGTVTAIEAMRASGVRRLVVLSANGTGETRDNAPWIVRKLLVGWILRAPFEDHERQEAAVRQSGLDWVIARPGRLTNGPALGRFVKRVDPRERVPSSISRADVGAFLVEACESDAWVGKAVQIGG